MSDQLKQYYKGKSNKPELFEYDDKGHLIERNKSGEVIKTIELPTYRSVTLEELDELEKNRQTEIGLATKEYDEAYRELHQEYQKPERLDSAILRLNRKVMEADFRLQAARYPLQYVLKESGIEIRKINFSYPGEVRKFTYDIAFLKVSPYKLEEQYVRIGDVQDKPMVSVVEAKKAIASNIPVILFSDTNTNEYGFLSLDWAVEIQYNSTMYHSVKQALAAELAKRFNDNNNLSRIMLMESAEEVNYSVENVPGDKEENEVKWNEYMKTLIPEINMIKFTQYPELASRLIETKNAILGAYIVNDNLLGIGISMDDMKAKNPIEWSGQNILGKALMDIRELIVKKKMEEVMKKNTMKKPSIMKKPAIVKKVNVPGSSIIPNMSSIPKVQSVPVISQSIPVAPAVSVGPVVSSVVPAAAVAAPVSVAPVMKKPGIGMAKPGIEKK